jgi:hypothetical protein
MLLVPPTGFPPSNVLELAVWLVATGKVLRGYWLQRSALNWPLAQGSIEHIDLSSEGHGIEKVFRVFMRYSYSLGGEFYGGEATLPFHDENRALEFVHRAKHASINVSVRPDKPEESTIIPEQLELAESALLIGKQPAFEEQSEFALPEAARWLLYLLMWTATLGVVASLIIHLEALRGRALITTKACLVVALCSLLIVLPTLLAEAWLLSGQAPGRKSAPPAVRYAVYLFWIVSGSYVIVGTYLPRPLGPTYKLQMVASLGEFLYASVIATIYPIVQARKASQAAMAAGSVAVPRA